MKFINGVWENFSWLSPVVANQAQLLCALNPITNQILEVAAAEWSK